MMADTILTLAQLKTIFYTLTCQLLGLNPDDPGSFSKVRKSWQTRGAPAWGINDDVVFLRITSAPDSIIQQRDTIYSAGTTDSDNVTIEYTRVHLVSFNVYGPNSFDNAESIRNGLYDSDLSANNLYLVLDVPNVQYAPELFNGQWWERADFSVRFNEGIQRQGTVPTISSVNIQIQTEEGVIEDANSST